MAAKPKAGGPKPDGCVQYDQVIPKFRAVFCALCFLASVPAVKAADTAPAEARYEALRFGKIKMHTGPGQQYPVAWVYQRKGLPVKVTATYDVWRKIVDADGTTGWVQENMLSDKRTIAVTGGQRHLRHDPSDTAATVALADPGTVAQVTACKSTWCHVKFADYEGWLKQSEIWGTAQGETFGAAD